MSWQKEIDELRHRETLAKRMGGEEKVARHHRRGKLTVRERVNSLLDPGSFHEIGSVSGSATYDSNGELSDFTPTNFIFGRGKIDGRRVVVAGDDFTVRGGANDAGILEKALASERIARDLRLPIIRLVDGTGGGGSVKNIEIEERLERLRSPLRSAEAFMPEEIIDPRDTRPFLCEFANMAAPLRTPGPRYFTVRP